MTSTTTEDSVFPSVGCYSICQESYAVLLSSRVIASYCSLVLHRILLNPNLKLIHDQLLDLKGIGVGICIVVGLNVTLSHIYHVIAHVDECERAY